MPAISTCQKGTTSFSIWNHRMAILPSRISFACVEHHLNEGGTFCYADLFHQNDFGQLEHELTKAGFEVVEKEDIGSEVVKSIQINAPKAFKFSENNPRITPNFVHNVNVTTHSQPYRDLQDGTVQYWRYILKVRPEHEVQKP